MENNQEREDLNKIRHFKGSVADFKNFWDEMAGKNTNSYGTPEYQGFNDVHPTRGEGDSEHWKTSNVDGDEIAEGKKDAYSKFLENPENPKGKIKNIIADFLKWNGSDSPSTMAAKRYTQIKNLSTEEGYILKYLTRPEVKITSKPGGPDFSIFTESTNSTDTKITHISSFENFQG